MQNIKQSCLRNSGASKVFVFPKYIPSHRFEAHQLEEPASPILSPTCCPHSPCYKHVSEHFLPSFPAPPWDI